MRRERSCGIVVFRERAGAPREYLLLHYPGGHWDFPKGHVEQDESEDVTALRELQEETGITDVRLMPGFRETIRYRFKGHDRQMVDKSVVFFTGRSSAGKIQLSHEHQGYVCVPYRDAKVHLTFAKARRLLQQVETFLAKT